MTEYIINRLWKYLLLIFREDDLTKYALEALNLHLQVYGLSPRLAFELMWSRFINSSGGKGKMCQQIYIWNT